MGDFSSIYSVVPCPKAVLEEQRVAKGTCYMDFRTKPAYRQTMETYRFLMHMTNELSPNGSVVPFPIDSYAVRKSVDQGSICCCLCLLLFCCLYSSQNTSSYEMKSFISRLWTFFTGVGAFCHPVFMFYIFFLFALTSHLLLFALFRCLFLVHIIYCTIHIICII